MYNAKSKEFTRGSRTPASIYLRWKDGVYAVDVDKSYDLDETILSVLVRRVYLMCSCSRKLIITRRENHWKKY
jgi:hypothetical protein